MRLPNETHLPKPPIVFYLSLLALLIPGSHAWLWDKQPSSGATLVAPKDVILNQSVVHQNHTECPEWIAKYVEFHKSSRALQGSKYMLYFCDAKHKYHCAGTGDRIRAMMEAVRLSMFSSRSATLLHGWLAWLICTRESFATMQATWISGQCPAKA